jgi:hypothetical protein
MKVKIIKSLPEEDKTESINTLKLELKEDGTLTIAEPDFDWEAQYVYLYPSQVKQLREFLNENP